jgi:hypothetical protein
VQRAAHLLLRASHPHLDGALNWRRVTQEEALPLARPEVVDLLVRAHEAEVLDVVEQLEQVDADRRRIRRAEHREQLVVGHEEEAREGIALRVEVLREALLAVVEALAEQAQRVEAASLAAAVDDVGVLRGRRHDRAPLLVDEPEALRLFRELLADVLRAHEDACADQEVAARV